MYSLRCARSHVSPLERPVRRRVSVYIICDGWVAPFGYLRVEGCSHLSAAYRSVPRPSSPVYAKASTNCPYLTLENPHHHRQSCLRKGQLVDALDRKSTRLNSSHLVISYAVFCLKKKRRCNGNGTSGHMQ